MKPYEHKIQEWGKIVGAQYAMLIDGRLRHFYKKGDRASRNCPYFMDEKLVWKNSCNSSLATTFASYRMTHKNVVVIKIEL